MNVSQTKTTNLHGNGLLARMHTQAQSKIQNRTQSTVRNRWHNPVITSKPNLTPINIQTARGQLK